MLTEMELYRCWFFGCDARKTHWLSGDERSKFAESDIFSIRWSW